MKDVGYFSHDANAHHDPKIIKMLAKHGWQSYGLFWAIIEMLRNESEYQLNTDYDTIAYALRSDSELIKNIVEDFDLFIIDDDVFHSARLDKCMAIKEEKSEKARQSSLKRWERNANAMQTHTDRNASKVKESKRKVNKDKDIKSLDSINKEYLNELQEKHLDIDVPLQFEKFTNYLSANGKTYKDYRAGFRNWLVSGFCEKTDKIKIERENKNAKKLKLERKKYLEENSASGDEVKALMKEAINKVGRKYQS